MVTHGPAFSDPALISRAIEYGVRAFRFSASKHPLRTLTKQARFVEALGRDQGAELDLMLDLPGAKPRLANDEPIDLSRTERLRIALGRAARPGEIGVTCAELVEHLEEGDILVLGDGEDALKVVMIDEDVVEARPLTRGIVSRRRGLAVSGKPTRVVALTDQDRAALSGLRSTPFGAVALSFVESGATVVEARSIIASHALEGGGPLPAIVAKVETAAAAKAIDGIAGAADAVLLGRGDMLLSTGEAAFPKVCDSVVAALRASGKRSIVGTGLFSHDNPTWYPRQSELAYVFGLLSAGVDGLMLAAETAVAPDPLRWIRLTLKLADHHGTSRVQRLFAAGPGAQ